MFNKKRQCRISFFIAVLLSLVFHVHGQHTFRVLGLFTPAVETGLVGYTNGGASSAKSFVEAWGISELNGAFYKSVPTGSNPLYHVEVAGIDSVTYTESGDIAKDNDSVLTGKGAFAKVGALRDRYAADLILLVVNNPKYPCGVSTTAANPRYGTPYYCVSVVQFNCLPDRFSSVHELGHLFGCEHAWWDPDSDAYWLFAHGWGDKPTTQNPQGTWGTIMSYNNGRQLFYSSPLITYNGAPCGKIDSAYNARVFTDNVAGVNNFRSTPAIVTLSNDTINGQEYGNIRANSAIIINAGFTVKAYTGSAIGQLDMSIGAVNSKRAMQGENNDPGNAPVVHATPSVTRFSIQTGKKAIIVRYSLSDNAGVWFKLLTIQGKTVMEKDLGLKTAGNYTQTFKLSSHNGHQMYVVIMRGGNRAFRQVVML